MDRQAIVKEFYLARDNLDIPRHLSFTHRDCVYRIVGTDELSTLTKKWTGRKELEEVATALFPMWDFTAIETVTAHECGNTIYVHRKGKVGYPYDKSSLTTEFLDKITFEGDEIIEYLQFIDTFAVANFLQGKSGVAIGSVAGSQA